jgi:hypothetical protein
MTFLNVRMKPARTPTDPPELPRTTVDQRGVLHIELSNQACALAPSWTTHANGVRLMWDSVGRLIGIEIAPRA